ncbi:MMPL family transporter [Mycobacterium uberis]|uniref:MMPL family transporter n=1 Tax=Mycobacterium uberis TaxID=2162698 RepID=UPI000E3036C2
MYVTRTEAAVKDIAEGTNWDLLVAGIVISCFIFIVMLIRTHVFCRRRGDCQYGGLVARCFPWAVGIDLTAHC